MFVIFCDIVHINSCLEKSLGGQGMSNNSHVRRNHIHNHRVERIPELDCTLQQQVDQPTQQPRSSKNNDIQPEFETLPNDIVMRFGLKEGRV